MIVTGIDWSEDSRTALRWAVCEGEVLRSPVTAVHVGPAVYDLVAKTPYAEERRASLRETLRAFVSETLGDADVAIEVVDGPPAEGLVSQPADLLVLGRHGAGAVARLLLGSTAGDVLHAARCPVAVVPPGAVAEPPARIVAGTDGSDDATHAVGWAVRAAVAHRVPLAIVHAAPGNTSNDAATAFLDDVVEKARADAGNAVAVTGVLSWEPSVTALLTTARPGDLLVVGTRGLGLAGRLLLGSTSTAVAQQSPCPVVVVPAEVTP